MPSPTPAEPGRTLLASRCGTLSYESGLALLEQARAEALERLDGGLPVQARVYLLEHHSTVTLGRRGKLVDVLMPPEELAGRGVAIHRCDRGGEVTWHGPGQLVAYPVVSLQALGLTVPEFVEILGNTVVDVLGQLGLEGSYDPTRPGVWVAGRKVASVGLRVSRGVTSHGLSLNLTNSLEPFAWIVPCGSQGATMTSVGELLGERARQDLEPMEVGATLARHLATRLDLALAWEQTVVAPRPGR